MLKTTYMKPPMRYPGNKYSSLAEIVPKLPNMSCFVDVFGGSGSVLLARKPSGLEVYNDRFSGLVDFYRCIRDHLDPLVARLNVILHSREEWERCKATWEEPDPKTVEGLVERAARWYYTVQMAYGGVDRAWARSLRSRNEFIAQYRSKIELFPTIHERFKNVQIENLDWYQAMIDYDSPLTTFYLDPPYMNTNDCGYKSKVDHNMLIDSIFKMKGFVAVSGYPNELYDKQNWTTKYTWERNNALGEGKVTEVLWIKE